MDIDDERQKEILAQEAKCESSNLFEVLGVSSGATTDDVRLAFRELSRKFHPDRFFGKQLGPFKGRLDKIFRKLVEANQTLSDPDKRRAYLEANPFVRAAIRAQTGSGVFQAPAAKSEAELARDKERQSRLARHPYLARAGKVHELVARAKECVTKKEFSQAFTHLNTAAQMDPQNAEVKVMLADVRRMNEQLRSDASLKAATEALDRGDDKAAVAAYKTAVQANPANDVAAFKLAILLEKHGADPKETSTWAQRAVDAKPDNAEYRVLLGRLLDAGGMKALAKKHFEEAVRLAPDHPEVKKHVKKRWPF